MHSKTNQTLSRRQTEIAKLVKSGKTSRQIGEALFIDSRTVDSHVDAICNKLGVRTRVELVVALFGADASAEPAARAQSTNLPRQRNDLIGRRNEVKTIIRLLRQSRLVTITGSGGVGKTQIALAVGNDLLDGVQAEVWLVELAPLTQGSFVGPAIAQALGVQESPNRPLLETLRAHLKQRRLLLIFDNCEHVIAEAAAFADALLHGCDQLRILATSREPLRMYAEQTYRLPSLRVPTASEVAGLDAAGAREYAAVELFAQRARRGGHAFVLSDDNAPIVAEICRRLDGIPLAIELAAARVNVLSLHTLAAKLDQRLRILNARDRTALPRQQTMRALIDWSYDLLSAPEQQLFERLSIFSGGCTLAAVTAIFGDDAADEFNVLERLSSLVDKSLVVTELDTPEPRYRLLESFREYAYERLTARGDAPVLARRHALAYVELAERLEREHDVAPDAAWFARARQEIENWRAALHWALVERCDVVVGQRLAGAMRAIWLAFSIAEGRRWLSAALSFVDGRTPAIVAANLEYAAATVAYLYCEFEAALAGSRRLIDVYRQLGDPLGAARAEFVAGRSLANLGRVAEGEPLLHRALAAARSLGNAPLLGLALAGIARARSLAGDVSAARVYLAEAFAIYDAIGAEGYPVVVESAAASAEFCAGNFERAVHLSTAALTAMRAFGFTLFVTMELNYLAAYLIACKNNREAHARAREALALARETQQYVEVAWALQHIAAATTLSSDDVRSAPALVKIAGEIVGYVDARIAALGTSRQYIHQQAYDRVRSVLRDAIGAAHLDDLLACGAAMTQERAIESARSLTY